MTMTNETPKQAARRLMASYLKKGYEAEALHTYTDSEGAPLHWRIRLKHDTADKVIRPMALINGAYELKEPPYPEGKPLYNQFKIASEPTAPVWIVEGEKCADELNKLGLIATTSGGADSAKTTRWQLLTGREVMIWRDNDTAGLKYQADIAEILHPLNCKIKFVDVEALNLAPKADCVDWLADFETQQGRKAEINDLLNLPLIDDHAQAPTSDYLPTGEETIPTDNETQPSEQKSRTDDDVIERLAALSILEYERLRVSEAKALGCRPSVLDEAVKKARNKDKEADTLPFPNIEPHPEPVNPSQLLNEISETIRQFIVLDKEQADAAALWVAFTWFIDVVEVAPLAIINAPEKACGKSQLLTLIGRLSARPLPASNSTAAGLFRAVELWRPTVLIDEADTFIRENEELKGLVNAGHTRANAFVLRVVGDNHEPKMFKVWGAKAFAGIALEKHLPDATMSRAVIFELRRKLSHERVMRIRYAEASLFNNLASKLARFADDYASEVQQARPHLPDELGDRAQDNWEPLLAIAECAGADWVNRAIVAALKLSGAGEKSISTGNELLTDIQHVFESRNTDTISTADLITALCDDDEGAWATYNRGKPLTPRQLARMLSGYGISSENIRDGYSVKKGFKKERFTDAFERYLATPPNLALHRYKSPEANKDGLSRVADETLRSGMKNTNATLDPAPNKGCSVVADKTPIFGGVENTRPNDDVMVF